MSALVLDDPVPVFRAGALLGEGPCWHAAEQALWFVDIVGQRVHRFDPATRTLGAWAAPDKPGWVLPMECGRLLVGMPGGLHRFDPARGSFVRVASLEAHLPGNRLNDATVAPDGALWFGTMDDAATAATGRVYRLGPNGPADTHLPPVVITNGPAVSPDGRTLYHVDTLFRLIWRVPIADGASLGVPERFARIEESAGYPDGVTVDAAGNVWVGLYGGWAVRCYAPDGGLRAIVRFPVENVTKIAFGGPDLRTAFATTASQGLDAVSHARQPHAGDLFAFHVSTPGQALPLGRLPPSPLSKERSRA